MAASQTLKLSELLKNLQAQLEEDPEKILKVVDSQFQSEEISREVRLHLNVLKKLSSEIKYSNISEGLRNEISKIFSIGGTEQEILENLKKLTEIDRADGGKMDLRRFIQRERRIFDKVEYNQVLTKKIQNTENQIYNLMAFYPDSSLNLRKLAKSTRDLIKKLKNKKPSMKAIIKEEDEIRQTHYFETYEELKVRFLRNWLAQFTSISEAEMRGMSHEKIQELVMEHQRHQMTHLLKTEINLSDIDMSGYLNLHDTLECGYNNEEFWGGANIRVRNGFRKWILTAIQCFAMMRGQRHAFFHSMDNEEQFLLFGLGLIKLPESEFDPVEMMPFIKPFTKKAGYLLEIHKRDFGDPDQYHHELRHAVLPFLFGFDQLRDFPVEKELITFFTSNY